MRTLAEQAAKLEREIERRVSRKLARDDKAIAIRERKEAKAERMIGQLASGKFYVYPVGGEYREGSESELIDYLIRKGFV